MSGPVQIKAESLSTLRATRRAMSSARWLMIMKKRSLEERREAAFKRMAAEQMILTLGNVNLTEIRTKLKGNETELSEARAALIKAREKLNYVRAMLAAVTRMLDVLSRVVKTPVGL